MNQIIVDRKALERELTIAKKVIGKGNSLMICQSVRLAFYEDGIAIQSTNLGRAYTGVIGDPLYNYWVPDNSEKVLIDADRFMKVVKAIPKKITEVSLEITWEDHGLLINGTTTIVGSGRVDDYPTLPQLPVSRSYNLFSYDAFSQVSGITYCKEDKRVHINHLYADTKTGRLVSTDGSRLYVTKIPITESLKPFMIEKNAVNILCTPQLRDHIGPVRLDKRNVFFITGNGYMTIRLPEDAEFPNYGMVCEYFGQDPEAIISMSDKQIVIDAMNEAQGILSDRYRGITVDINGHVIISAVNPDLGEFKKDISKEVDAYSIGSLIDYDLLECTLQLQNHIGYLGKNMTFGFNPAYIIDACKQIPDTGLNLLFPGENKPMLIQSAINDFQVVIMPMRV